MMKSYVICHMVMSIDGKVTGKFLSENDSVTELYYRLNREFHADAYACGRVTMESSFTQGYKPDLKKYEGIEIPRKDYIADKEATFFAVSYDRYGSVGWTTSRIIDEDSGYGNAHIIEVLSEKVNDAYLAYLQEIGVSYIFAGESDISIATSLHKLKKLFGIETLLLEGGSIINGAFLKEDVVDELSLVISPVIGDFEDKPLFSNATLSKFLLKDASFYGGIAHLEYVKE